LSLTPQWEDAGSTEERLATASRPRFILNAFTCPKLRQQKNLTSG